MVTLCMETSQQFLVVALIQNEKIIAQHSAVCLRKQSEFIFPILLDLCKKNNIIPQQIKEVVITDGPGSYTGVRIAMTIAKMLASQAEIKLYTISTLQLYSGAAEKAWVVLDARANRVYLGRYQNGYPMMEDTVMFIDEVQKIIGENEDVYGDGALIQKENKYPDFALAFLKLKKQWKLVENVHTLVPKYLKESTSYLVD